MTFLIVMMISSIVIMSSSDYGPDSIKKIEVPVKITNEYAVICCLETQTNVKNSTNYSNY